jgi:adenylosuccinate synthase
MCDSPDHPDSLGIAFALDVTGSMAIYRTCWRRVIHTYLTRHGAGPLPTHDKSLDGLPPEPHNGGNGWQGTFRRKHPDTVLLRYALAAAGRLAGLFISHLDVFQRGLTLKWCERYSVEPPLPQGPRYVDLGNAHLP